MGYSLYLTEAHGTSHRFHTLRIRPPPIRWISILLRMLVKNSTGPLAQVQLDMCLKDHHLTRNCSYFLQGHEWVAQVVKYTEKQHYIKDTDFFGRDIHDIHLAVFNL